MKNYNLTLISGQTTNFVNEGVSEARFNTLFFTNAGEAQFTPDTTATSLTIWDSSNMTGKSISTTESVEANKPYVGSWASSGQTTNTFMTFEDAKA